MKNIIIESKMSTLENKYPLVLRNSTHQLVSFETMQIPHYLVPSKLTSLISLNPIQK